MTHNTIIWYNYISILWYLWLEYFAKFIYHITLAKWTSRYRCYVIFFFYLRANKWEFKVDKTSTSRPTVTIRTVGNKACCGSRKSLSAPCMSVALGQRFSVDQVHQDPSPGPNLSIKSGPTEV